MIKLIEPRDYASFARDSRIDVSKMTGLRYASAAQHVWSRFKEAYPASVSSFVRIAGSFAQDLAISDYGVLDLVFFIRCSCATYINKHNELSQLLKAWAKEESQLRSSSDWLIEPLIGGLDAQEPVMLCVRNTIEEWSVDIHIITAIDIFDGVPLEDVDVRSMRLHKFLTLKEARKLYFGFYTSIRITLENSEGIEPDTLGSRIGIVKEQAKGYIDCVAALMRELPQWVRDAIVILKVWQNICIKERLSKFPPEEVNDLPQLKLVIKQAYLPSYALATFVVGIWRTVGTKGIDDESERLGQVVNNSLVTLASLNELDEPLEVGVDDFYKPSSWPSLPRNDRRMLYIRDPINPVNDLAAGTNTSVIVKMAVDAIEGIRFKKLICEREQMLSPDDLRDLLNVTDIHRVGADKATAAS